MMRLFRQYLFIVFIVLLALNYYAIRRYTLAYPYPLGPRLDNFIRQNHTKNINENNPEIVLIGDSTLTKGVDSIQLSEKLGKSLYSIDLPGSASTLWYLIIKNNIFMANTPPKYLVIFFRDNMLTMPGYRVQGQYFEQIDEYSDRSDTILIEHAFIGIMNPLERFAEAYIPLYARRWQIREEIESRVRYLPAQSFRCAPKCVDAALAESFNNENINMQGLNAAISAADENLYTGRNLNFHAQEPKSFLPEIIHMAEENDTQIILIRMKTLQFTEPYPMLDQYMNDLKTYAYERNISILDFENDPRLPSQYFMDTLHLNDKGKIIFTDILSQTLKPFLH
jgi:hypothetical protein